VVHSVKDMSADQRLAVESLLGRQLRDEERVSIRPIPVTKDAPPLSRRLEISEAMREYFARIDEQRTDAPEEEIDAVIDEALRHVRPSYKPIR
jgi:hypothetical protein